MRPKSKVTILVALGIVGISVAVMVFTQKPDQSVAVNQAVLASTSFPDPLPMSSPAMQAPNPVIAMGPRPEAASRDTFADRQPAESAPYVPTVEEQRRYDELKARVYNQDMTMSKFLMTDEFGALPQPLKDKLMGEVVGMLSRHELDRAQFLDNPQQQASGELPPDMPPQGLYPRSIVYPPSGR